jgi:hypothetical protein
VLPGQICLPPVRSLSPASPEEAVRASGAREGQVWREDVRALLTQPLCCFSASSLSFSLRRKPPALTHTSRSLPALPPCSARAVDLLCRPQFTALAQCLQGSSGDVSKCVPQTISFDVCTEDW